MANSQDFRSLLVDVLISDRETEGHPVSTDEQRPSLIEDLALLVLDADALSEHRRWLGANDRARRHRAILPDQRMEEVLGGGLDILRNDELAELALNPFALHDLADSVAELLPDAWMPRIEEAAAALVRRLEVSFPDLDSSQKFDDSPYMPVFAGGFRETEHGHPESESKAIRLAFPEDDRGEEFKRRLADHLFGDPSRPFNLELIEVFSGTSEADLRYELELSPAPSRDDLDVTLLFPNGSRRVFSLEVPPEVRRGEPPRSRTRSEPCDPLPAPDPRIRGIAEPIGTEWPPTLRMS